MTQLQVAEDIWYAVLDVNGYPIYYTPDKKKADTVSETIGGDVILMDDLT